MRAQRSWEYSKDRKRSCRVETYRQVRRKDVARATAGLAWNLSVGYRMFAF